MSMLLDYSVIFEGEQPLPMHEYLNGINRARLKMITSHFLGIDFQTSDLNDWRELLKMWFRHENYEFANKVWERCELLEKKYGSVTFLSIPAFLKFFEFVKTFTESHEEVDDVLSEKNLFIVYLLFLSAITDKERKSEKHIEGLHENRKLCALILNQQFPYGEYSNFQLGDVLKTQIIKACYLFVFLENKNEASFLLNTFCTFYRLNKWQEFFQFIIPIIQAHALHPKKGGWTHLNVIRNEKFEKNCFFLESLAQEVDIESDFKSIRTNPLYKVNEGVYGIIFPLFVVEKIFKGSYFRLKELNDLAPLNDPSIVKISNWKKFYTTNFSESTLLYSVLEHIYGRRSYIQYTGDFLKDIDKNGPPDYYIRNGNDLYLFENKDVYINADLRQSFDFEKLEQAFKEKLYFNTELKENGSLKIKPKAVMQLGRNVKKALVKGNKFDTNYNQNKLRIYPILILHDSSFECPGLNSLVNFWFDIEMKKLQEEGVIINGVRKITIINIDTLILYADFLREKKQTLNSLIDEYVKHGIFKLKNRPMTKQQFEETYATTYDPFSIFIDKFTNVGHQHVRGLLADTVMKTIFKN